MRLQGTCPSDSHAHSKPNFPPPPPSSQLFTRPTALTLFPTMHLHRWSFDVELLLLAQQLGLPIAEVPIRWHEVEGSKISVGWDGLGMARDLVVLRGNLALGRWVVPSVVGAKEE